MSELEKNYGNETWLIHGRHRTEKWDYTHHVIPPMTASTTFRLDSASRGQQGFVDFGDPRALARALNPIYIYDRLDEPTVGMMEEVLCEAEHGEAACAFACGMAAVSAAIMITGRSGSNVVAHRTLYGCTFSLMTNWLPRFGIKARFVNASDLSHLVDSVDDDTRAVYIETPANPTLECIDIAAVKAALAPINAGRGPKAQVLLIVDNTFCTPVGQRPLTLGADIVVESLTKNVGGFGVDMGGVAVFPQRLARSFRGYRKDFGGVLPPANAWRIMVHGLSTLSLRLRRQSETAMRVAGFLEGHPAVARVMYPGLASFPWSDTARAQMLDPEGRFCPGLMIYFEVAGGLDEARARCEKVINAIASDSYCITLAVSLGMAKTLVEAPGLMTHSALDARAQSEAGIHPGGIRLSIGLENADDIIADLGRALD
jgi:cystathionine beta-lyase/cystathionine gamma-synthase